MQGLSAQALRRLSVSLKFEYGGRTWSANGLKTTSIHKLKDPASDYEVLAKSYRRHRSELSPGQLLPLLREFCRLGPITSPPIHGIFASSYRQQPAALEAALELYPILDPRTQMALLYVLRRTGVNLRERMPSLPADVQTKLEAVESMKVPEDLPHFVDPVLPKQVSELGHKIDLCWAAWMATGESKYLRALVDLLAGAPDFKVFEEWTARKGGAAGLNASVARGLGYRIAGWSIGSFQRTDPLVADWLAYWRKQPDFPKQLSDELGTLPTNPAFQKNGK